mgnify:CR=1 FL=1
MLITNEGTIIRMSVSGINEYSRTAGGVILMRLSEGGYINNVARLEKTEDIERESLEVEKEIEAMPKEDTAAAKDADGESDTETEE